MIDKETKRRRDTDRPRTAKEAAECEPSRDLRLSALPPFLEELLFCFRFLLRVLHGDILPLEVLQYGSHVRGFVDRDRCCVRNGIPYDCQLLPLSLYHRRKERTFEERNHRDEPFVARISVPLG